LPLILRRKWIRKSANALKPIIKDARSKVDGKAPGDLINWNDPGYERKPRVPGKRQAFPSYNQTIIRRGLTYSVANGRMKNSGFVSLFTLFNKSRTGAIIETAGRVGSPNPRAASNNPEAGERFIGAMNGIGGLVDYSGRGRKSTGRLLYAAYARNQGRALNATLIAVEKAKRNLANRILSDRRAA
jgi:hypothetical protein